MKIVKLGGSAITFKDQFETINDSSLREIVRLVKEEKNLVVVHGAGA